MDFEIIGAIRAIEPIAIGAGIRDRRRLQRLYGKDGGENCVVSRPYASQMVRFTQQSSTGTKRMGSEGRNLRWNSLCSI